VSKKNFVLKKMIEEADIKTAEETARNKIKYEQEVKNGKPYKSPEEVKSYVQSAYLHGGEEEATYVIMEGLSNNDIYALDAEKAYKEVTGKDNLWDYDNLYRGAALYESAKKISTERQNKGFTSKKVDNTESLKKSSPSGKNDNRFFGLTLPEQKKPEKTITPFGEKGSFAGNYWEKPFSTPPTAESDFERKTKKSKTKFEDAFVEIPNYKNMSPDEMVYHLDERENKKEETLNIIYKYGAAKRGRNIPENYYRDENGELQYSLDNNSEKLEDIDVSSEEAKKAVERYLEKILKNEVPFEKEVMPSESGMLSGKEDVIAMIMAYGIDSWKVRKYMKENPEAFFDTPFYEQAKKEAGKKVSYDSIEEANEALDNFNNPNLVAYTNSRGENITWREVEAVGRAGVMALEAQKSKDFAEKSKFDKTVENSEYIIVNSEPSNSWGEGSLMPYTEPNYFLTPEERAVYNYYYKTNKDKADEYLTALSPLTNKRLTTFNVIIDKARAEESPGLASVAAPFVNLSGIIPGTAYTLFSGDDYDPYSKWLQPEISADTTIGTVSENIDEPLEKFAYKAAMGIADTAVRLPLGAAGLGLAAGDAFTSKGREIALRGGNSDQRLFSSLAAGGAEYFWEKVGLDNLFKLKSVGTFSDFWKVIKKQGIIEGLEELGTGATEILVDELVMKEKSQFNTIKKKYIDEGESRLKASLHAAWDMGGDLALETAMGLVSGMFFGTGSAVSNYSGSYATGKAIKEQGNTATVVAEGKMQDENSSAYKRANAIEAKKGKTTSAEIGALLRQMIIDGQISESNANKLVSEGLNGLPLDEAEQAYYYAGANGVSALEAARTLSDLNADPERALKAWQKGAENKGKYTGKETSKALGMADINSSESATIEKTEKDIKNQKTAETLKADTSAPTVTTKYAGDISKAINETAGATVNPITRKVKPFEVKTEETSTPAIKNDGDVAETPAVKNDGRAKSIVKENYNEAAEKFRTEENAEMFDVAYSQGLLGEKLNLGVIVPDKDISAISQAYVAGTRDARIISERRANFDNRTPGLFTDAVTEQLSKKFGSRTLNAIDALGKKLGVQIHFIQRGEAGHERDSYYSPSDGVIAINVNEIHGKLTGDKLLRFIANHEGIHRIKETSPKAYAEMEKIALSKSKQTVEDRMARFGESKERATEEIVADYFGEVLTSKAEIKTLLNKHRSVFDAIMEALEWLVDKMRGIANYSFSEIAEARKLFQEALNEADAKAWGAEVRSDGEALYGRSEGKTLNKPLNEAENIEENSYILVNMDSVADLTGKELEGPEDLKTRVAKLFEKFGNMVQTKKFGDVALKNSSIRSEFRHGTTPDKVNSYAAIPNVLNNGVVIDARTEGQGKYEKVVVAAPITIAGKNFYMGVMLKRDKLNQRLYVHDVITKKEGSAIRHEHLNTTGPANSENLYVTDILEKAVSVGNYYTLNPDKRQEKGFKNYSQNSDKLFSRSEDSEDNVKYFPPGEDPRRDIKVPSEVNGKKVRRFTRTAAESPALTPEMAEDVVSEIENGRFYYTPSSNKALADNAMNKVENDVIQAASEWKTAFDSGKMITDKDIAIGEALIIEAGKRGDTERAIELISEVGIAATEAGKVVQAIKLLKRMTPEGQVYYLSKVVERLNKERGKTKGKEFDKSIEAENKATEADKKYKQAEAKVKTAEEKLFDIETAIEEYTKDLDIEVKIAESVEKIADLKKKLSEVKGKVKSADASTEKLGDNIKEIEGQLEEERKKLKEAMAKRDANLKERAEKGIMLSKLKAGVKRVDNATDHILSQIDILEDDISKVEAEYDKAVKFRDECAEERRRLVEEKNSLIRKTESAGKASERDLKKISQLEEEISKLSDKYLVAKKTAEDAAEIRKQLTAERNKLRDKLERKENAVVRENEKIAKLKEEIAQLLNAEYEASKEVEKAKEERTLMQKAKDKAKELAKTAKAGANIIELPADIKKAILESKTEEELNESVELAKDYIAENMVATKAEMIRAWRYLSMLGNLRTQDRNIIGNGLMLLNVYFKNAVATPIEFIAVYASHKNLEKQLAKMKADGATEAELKAYRDEHYAERTKTWTLFKKKSSELKSFVTESWESNIKLAKGQSGKNDNIIGDINDRRTIFKSEKPVLKQVAAGVEAWRKATNWAMERGDEVFLRINYKHALTSYILSNKWDVATMTEAQKMKAEQYALKEAQEATFRDDSALADWINKGRNKGWAAELAIGGLMPFTKTPINITKRSIEYGPTGIVNAIVQGVKASKGEATSADVVNALAKTFSGSVLAGLGFYLAAMGLLRSKGDEEDEEYNYLIGEQDYSLIIGDYRFSLEWAAPAAIPLLFGASIYNAWFDKDGGIKEEYMVDENGNLVLNTRAMAMHKVMNATSAMFAPIFEASYLSGLTDSVGAAFSFGSGDASEGLAIFGINAGLSYANQFIPTVFGQIARTIDPSERRNNDYNKTLPLSYSVQKGIAKAKNKIPGLNQTSTPYINAWGEEEIKQGALDYILSGAENIILPGYIEKVTDDELTDELWRLEKTEAAEGKKVFPESVKTSYTEDGKTLPLTAEQRNERQKVTGQKGREYIEAFYNSDEYGKLTDAERVEAIDLLWAKANEEGIQAVSPDYVSKDSDVIKMNITEKNVGISPVDYALWKIAYEKADEDENGSYNTDEVNAALDIFIELSGEEWTDEQLGYLWETRASALSKSNPYGKALLGTPWYQRKKEEGNTWMKERE
jgi:hypothetical protein